MTGPADPSITVEDDPNGAVAEEAEQKLVEALRRNVPPSDAQPLTLVARNPAGEMMGALIGATSYGWLLVKMLWVAEDLRGRGLGARMMAEAEALARSRGCHGAWLDTSSARAEHFYMRLGYQPFGILQNEPGEKPLAHRRSFLAKRLST
jgi:predicted N-acetyltransferase YhbS